SALRGGNRRMGRRRSFCFGSGWSSGRGRLGFARWMQSQPGNVAFVTCSYLKIPATGMSKNCPNGRNLSGQEEGQAPNGVDILLDLGQARVNPLAHIVELGPGIGLPGSVAQGNQQVRRRVVMLVLDLADDLLDQI